MNAPVTSAPASIDLDAVYRESGVGEVLDQLDRELVGLKPVKARIREIAALLLVDKLRRDLALTSVPPTLHMSFTGNPGTGKTTESPQAPQGRRFVHRRALFPLPPGKRARLGAEGDRDPPPAQGEKARPP